MRSHFKNLVAMAVVACSVGVVGCAGDPELYGVANSGLYDVTPDLAPLSELSGDAWHEAPADCVGRLGYVESLRFEVASVQDGLVAAVATNGEIVCVDTLRGVQEELTSTGHARHASTLGARFIVLVGVVLPNVDFAAADPSPQPSIDEGDPSPQPSSDPDEI